MRTMGIGLMLLLIAATGLFADEIEEAMFAGRSHAISDTEFHSFRIALADESDGVVWGLLGALSGSGLFVATAPLTSKYPPFLSLLPDLLGSPFSISISHILFPLVGGVGVTVAALFSGKQDVPLTRIEAAREEYGDEAVMTYEREYNETATKIRRNRNVKGSLIGSALGFPVFYVGVAGMIAMGRIYLFFLTGGQCC